MEIKIPLLVSAPVIQALNWELPFEIMCDASNHAVGVVLGQRVGKVSHVIYYASRTLDPAQLNYITKEKELLAVVFALEKFRPYLLGTKIVVYSYHSALKYLMAKKEDNLVLYDGYSYCKSLISSSKTKAMRRT